ncbi:unnamed protein product [Rhizoctonia solani]|uniref:F-box-like domain protein n=1 Tax=Rhizoctonia solani TaxID=456999 RepID=A0A8H3HVZ1_9AGAM|nr:unnamed protein product [Rhizoctonia solani]
MLDELNHASERLELALDQYLSVCTFIRDSCLRSGFHANDELFYNSLKSEQNKLLGHKRKLEEAQTAINVIRNTNPATNINSLPPEILIRIFSLVIDNQLCLIHSHYPYPPGISRESNRIRFPDSLSYVCSSWRRLTINIPHFWSHIDIALNHPLNPRLFERAKVFITRSGNVPLEVHICDPCSRETPSSDGFISSPSYGNSPQKALTRDPKTLHNFRFLLSSPAPIKSLNLDLVFEDGFQDYHVASLEYFLGNCTPEVLKCFSMQQRDFSYNHAQFIEPADRPQTRSNRLLAIPSQDLEHLWLSTTILRLNGSCPPWSSQAYHGLVELRLGDKVPDIRESQLVNILRLSPKLRVLHIKTTPQDSIPLDQTVEPVFLEDLEELDINQESEIRYTHGDFLRWIVPGSKPLQLTFYGSPAKIGPPQFCARSKVTRFFLERYILDSFVDMIRQSPWLEILAVNADNFIPSNLGLILPPIDQSYPEGLASTTRINTLYLLKFSDLPFEDIQAAVHLYSVKHLMIRCTSISYETEEGRKVAEDPQEIKTKLSTLQPLPVIEYLDSHSPHEPEHWWYS